MAVDATTSGERHGRAGWSDLSRIANLCGKAAVLALAAGSVAWLGFSAKALLLKYPPVWPDEADFANTAINFVHHGKLATEVFAGALPGIGQHTYLMPPVYFLYLAAVFRIAGFGIVSLRVSSMVLAPVVLALTYLLALRVGLNRWLSLLTVALLALDAVFLRAALTGRMEMLVLSLVLLSLWLASKSFLPSVGPGHSLLTGFACALATLTHPAGAVAPASVVTWCLLCPETRTRRSLLPLLGGIAIPFLPWLLYILLDPRSFVAQMGAQIARKLSAYTSTPSCLDSLLTYVGEYVFRSATTGNVLLVLSFWVVGLIGLAYSAYLASRSQECPRRRCLLLVCICQMFIFAFTLWSEEIWYGIYVIPLTAIGVCLLLTKTISSRPAKFGTATCASLLGLLVGAFLHTNWQDILTLKYLENGVYRSETNYAAWCADISSKIPQDSRVLISVIPDPYFGLSSRSDLSLRECLPNRFAVDHDAYWKYMSEAGYLVLGTGFRSPSTDAEEFVKSNAVLVYTVGKNDGIGYFARIYRVNKLGCGPHDNPERP